MANLGETQTFHANWRYDPSSVPVPVNQILLHVGSPVREGEASGEFYLTMGHMNPPVILPAADGSVDFVGIVDNELPVTVVGSFAISAARLVEFHEAMTAFIEQHIRVGQGS